ncbi:LOW QUALITY PROTEIN: hypothetical protein CRUP_037845 [Coryphaenoides rupestris]|nr:LOW QUALITY PROTEIN: hypothetical protein CRUP_037845 [Coryphaenoides rupestris]
MKKSIKAPEVPSKHVRNWVPKTIIMENQVLPKIFLEFLNIRHFPSVPKTESYSFSNVVSEGVIHGVFYPDLQPRHPGTLGHRHPGAGTRALWAVGTLIPWHPGILRLVLIGFLLRLLHVGECHLLGQLIHRRQTHRQLPHGAYHKVHTVSEGPSCYMYVYVNTTEAALQHNFTRLLEIQERVRNGTETEPLPPELQPLVAPDDQASEVNASDPVVQLFLRRQRRMKEVKKRREANILERLNRFTVKKYYLLRRGRWHSPNMKEPQQEANQDEPLKEGAGHGEL